MTSLFGVWYLWSFEGLGEQIGRTSLLSSGFASRSKPGEKGIVKPGIIYELRVTIYDWAWRKKLAAEQERRESGLRLERNKKGRFTSDDLRLGLAEVACSRAGAQRERITLSNQ